MTCVPRCAHPCKPCGTLRIVLACGCCVGWTCLWLVYAAADRNLWVPPLRISPTNIWKTRVCTEHVQTVQGLGTAYPAFSVSSGGDLRLRACSETVPFYKQAKHLQILVPTGSVDPTSPRTLGNDAVCFRLPR